MVRALAVFRHSLEMIRVQGIFHHVFKMIEVHLVHKPVNAGGTDGFVMVGVVDQEGHTRTRQTGDGADGKGQREVTHGGPASRRLRPH